MYICRLAPVHVQRCNAMDEVWVPTEFNRRTFVSSGVDPAKVRAFKRRWSTPSESSVSPLRPNQPHLTHPKGTAQVRVVPEPVDVDFFDPAHTEAAALPLEGATLVLGPRSETALTGTSQPASEAAAACAFLSVFKWEARKGWDVLVRHCPLAQNPTQPSVRLGEGCVPCAAGCATNAGGLERSS